MENGSVSVGFVCRRCRDWYYKGRHVLGEVVTSHRLSLLTQIIRLLLTMIPQQRGRILREPALSYEIDKPGMDTLLRDIPLP